MIFYELALVDFILNFTGAFTRALTNNGRPPCGFVEVQLEQKVINKYLFVAVEDALNEGLPVGLVVVAKTVEDIDEVASGQASSILYGKNV